MFTAPARRRNAMRPSCSSVAATRTDARQGAAQRLELIDKGSCSAGHQTPLLFVHGAWHAAWCWDEGFLDFFADKGYRAVALSLRGHGGSLAPKPLRSISMAEYVEDVVEVAQNLPIPPVVIGHSMGGFIVQKYLESHSAPVAVLLASIPPQEDGKSLMRFMRRHPWRTLKGLATGDTTVALNTPALAREQFFSSNTSESDVTRYLHRFQQESKRALYVDTAFLNLPKPRRVATPLLVLGAQSDGIFTPEEIHANARAYNTKAEIFPEMGHDMMLESGWRDVAERIRTWLTHHGI
ncbi:MAG TPA: alpha/beta fold hydrolase [Mycobacterium sp.]|nr:alpha/beta fold hydrolase [Mycobacterium sp.]